MKRCRLLWWLICEGRRMRFYEWKVVEEEGEGCHMN